MDQNNADGIQVDAGSNFSDSTTLNFVYTTPGIDLGGKEKPPYIVTDAGAGRLLMKADEDVKGKLNAASAATREHYARSIAGFERDNGCILEGTTLEARVDDLYHRLFPTRKNTHLRLCEIDEEAVSRLLDRRGKKMIVEKSDIERRLLSGRRLRIKYGIDPTGSRIHLDHAVPLLLLRELQQFGHPIVFLVGTFTARIGDPSGRDQGRPDLTANQITENIATYKAQVARILDVQSIEFVYNAHWYDEMKLSEFFGLLGHFTLAEMSARDFVASRTKRNLGVSLREFLYPVLQGWDSVEIKADLAVSGQDQEFNELQGRVLQSASGMEPQGMILTELLEGTDGQKMSKTYDNAIYIDDEPGEMFRKVMRIHDRLILQYSRLATTTSDLEIAAIESALSAGENPLEVKQRIADSIVRQYHGAAAATEAGRRWRAQFLESAPEDIRTTIVSAGEFSIVDLLTASGVAPSRNQARRQLQQGGVRVDGTKITDTEARITLDVSRPSLILRFGNRAWGQVRIAE